MYLSVKSAIIYSDNGLSPVTKTQKIIHEDDFENVVYKLSVVMFRPRFVNSRGAATYGAISLTILNNVVWFTHLPLSPHVYIGKLGQHCFM